MTLYKENPNLGIKVVETINGEKEYRRNCKSIKGAYYRMNDQCFKVEDMWYRVESGFILKDCENNEWVLKKGSNLIEGIVAMSGNDPIMGHFSPNKYNNLRVYGKSKKGDLMAINEAALADRYLEDVGNGVWYPRTKLNSDGIRAMKVIRNERNYNNKGYNIEDNRDEFREKIDLFAKRDVINSKGARHLGNLIGDITFGAELELSEGFIPDHLQYRHGIVMCRDGSIAGGEAVTVPMSGAKGITTLDNISKDLKDRARVDIHCSYHLHIGTIPKDRAFLCALYVLGYKIQDEIFKMFPYYKTNPAGIKRKNYCQKLGKLGIHSLKNKSKEGYKEFVDYAYTRIFTFLSDGTPPDEFHNRKQLQHPIARKWDRPSRYYWLNLQNMLFSERFTAEFRIHHATLNSQKMINWLLMCNAIIKYAEHNQEKIFTTAGKISLLEVLDYYKTSFPGKEGNFISEYLKAYYQDRVNYFQKDFEQGDYLSSREADQDKDFSFTYDGITSLL